MGRGTARLLALLLPAPLTAVLVLPLAGAGTTASGSDVPPAPVGGTAATARDVTAPGPARPSVAPPVRPLRQAQRHPVRAGARAPLPGTVPPRAWAAYQRAATVINAADRQCSLDWELLAAIGWVESDHGRHRAHGLDEHGVARPAVLGAWEDGGAGAPRVHDSDAGRYDGDRSRDRTVGPMQLLPGTWSAVAVDADQDGARDPQDVDDAALAAAVLLCAGPGVLSAPAARRSAVRGYNRHPAYVRLVLATARSYARTPDATSAHGARPSPSAAPTPAAAAPAPGRTPMPGTAPGSTPEGPGSPSPTLPPACPSPTVTPTDPAATAPGEVPSSSPPATATPAPAVPTSGPLPGDSPTGPDAPAEPGSPTAPAEDTDDLCGTSPATPEAPAAPEAGATTPQAGPTPTDRP